MHLHGFSRVRCSVMGNRYPVDGLRLLRQVRSITTKQPTKATATATKPDFYDDEEFEKKLSLSNQVLPEAGSSSSTSSLPKREKWQATMNKRIKVVEVDPDPVHTCETREDFYERKRVTFFQYNPHAELGPNDPENVKPGFLQLFRGKGLSLEKVQFMRSVVKVDVAALKEYYSEGKFASDTEDQKFRAARELQVGGELAAAHFMVFRDGKVRFHGREDWVQKDENDEYDLPGHKVDDLFVKDINASGTNLLYEGLENFRGCQQLESLNLSRCQYADNFFLDRICLQHARSLSSLDISHCRHISVGGITALCRLKKLQHLNVEGLNIPYLPLACLTLEDEIPGLEISGVSFFLEELDMLPDDEIELIHARLAAVSHVKDVTRKCLE